MKQVARGSGLLVSFEGIDASGKNTQSRMLFDYLKNKHVPCERLSFPDYSTSIGQEIKNYLLARREYSAEVRHILYAANRYELRDAIQRWKGEVKMVIINRYSESNFAYGVANGLPLSWLEQIESRMPKVDYVFYLRMPPEISNVRKAKRDRFEANLDFLKKVSEVYDALAESDPGRWFSIPADRAKDLIHYEVVRRLSALVPEIDNTEGSKTFENVALPEGRTTATQ
jgi:dTMP kinase